MAPRKRRPENTPLPKRWRWRYGGFYYRVPEGLEFFWDGRREFYLGATMTEAYQVWAERLQWLNPKVRHVADLLDKYAARVIPEHKSAATRTNKVAHLPRLRQVFGKMPLDGIEPWHIYQYIEKRGEEGGRVAGQREIETLSHALTKAVEWGLIRAHPFKGELRVSGNAPRKRYVEDWEIAEVMALSSRRRRGSVRMLQAYIAIKVLTGLRRTDLLNLRIKDCREDGLYVTMSKTDKPLIIERTAALDVAIEQAKAARPVLGPYLFCNRDGEKYIDDETGRAESFSSMWQRFMARVLKETKVTERFTEHDLRGKAGSDSDSLAVAQALLGHADASTTKRIYRRKPERVKPVK